ncbi:MAG: hypothetical protein AAFX78_14655 [Cyanobacteria bacterium J06638_20]
MTSQQKFIEATIAQWAIETQLLLQMQVVKKGLVLTEQLLRSISYKIVKEAAAGVRYDLTFRDYGRILDMNRRKASARQLNRKVLLGGRAVRVRKNATSMKWYSRNMFRQVYGKEGLFERLRDGYGAWALERVIEQLEKARA